MELWKDSQLQTDIQIRLIYIYIQTWGKMELRIDSQLQTDRQLDRQIDIYTYIYKYIDNKHGKRWNNRKIVNYTQTNRQKIYMQLGTIDIYVQTWRKTELWIDSQLYRQIDRQTDRLTGRRI